MKNRRNDFYKELDSYKNRRSGCGCSSLLIFFIGLTIIGEILLFTFFDQIRYNPKVERVELPKGEVSRPQVVKLSQVESEIIVPQGMLNLALQEALSKDLSSQINEEGIEISGKIGYLLPSNATVTLYPEVEGGDLNFKIISVKIGEISVSKALAFNVSALVERALENKIGKMEDYHLEAAVLSEAIMRLIYRQNGN
ncbi:MAG: hypothetical protein BWZ03_00510 [bacterium ADurb.BinA186]|nr:MAG: hypothetical protein BWZ03_00510 [bacterium ADurb.BinA186]